MPAPLTKKPSNSSDNNNNFVAFKFRKALIRVNLKHSEKLKLIQLLEEVCPSQFSWKLNNSEIY